MKLTGEVGEVVNHGWQEESTDRKLVAMVAVLTSPVSLLDGVWCSAAVGCGVV